MQVNDGLEIYRALSVLARRYQFRNRDEVCCYGLTVSQCYALQLLHQEGPISSSKLASMLSLDLSSVTRLVDQLLKKKLAVRQRGSDDGRVRLIQITDGGAKLVRRIEEDFGQLVAQALSDFSPEILKSLPDALIRLAAALESCEAGSTNIISVAAVGKLN
jgi:DNA-binding MarR family transcriptional regulator